MDVLQSAKRQSRMKRLWGVDWYETVRLLEKNTEASSDGVWSTVFCLLQGHRVLWWRSVVDFDNGVEPMGKLFLAGHAGLATLSPLELRQIPATDIPRIVCIFGGGTKITVQTQSVPSKDDLECAVELALRNKVD